MKKKWIIAISGGPDSMALFQLCINHQVNVVAAHVNYKKRESADRDEKGVLDFCEKHNIPLEILYPVQSTKENFQAWARKERYRFFSQCSQKHQTDGVLIAHHEDDVLETYLMQVKRKSTPRYYGLQEAGVVEGVELYRPLLKWTKKECIQFCTDFKTPWFMDESNLETYYQRNRVRHSIVEKMSEEQRQNVLKEMMDKNQELMELQEVLKRYHHKKLNLEEFNKEPEAMRILILRQWLNVQEVKEGQSSNRHMQALDKMLLSSRNLKIPLKKHWMIKQGKICEIVGNEDKRYHVVLKSYRSLKHQMFEVKNQGSEKEGFTVEEADYPIVIRNVQPGDFIELKIGKKKIHRWFIDKKIPLVQREIWPVVENCRGEIIFVPGIGCNVKHFSIKPNVFVVK